MTNYWYLKMFHCLLRIFKMKNAIIFKSCSSTTNCVLKHKLHQIKIKNKIKVMRMTPNYFEKRITEKDKEKNSLSQSPIGNEIISNISWDIYKKNLLIETQKIILWEKKLVNSAEKWYVLNMSTLQSLQRFFAAKTSWRKITVGKEKLSTKLSTKATNEFERQEKRNAFNPSWHIWDTKMWKSWL